MIDLRSDTVTVPTDEMRAAMARAEVGDDVYGEDPTVRLLEETAADMLGKEAAMFVTSGTQGNQVAVLAHTERGDEVITESEAHIFYYEVGAMAALAGVQVATVPGVRGQMPLSGIRAAVRDENIHFPKTSLICLENTHNRAGGAVLPLAYMQEVHQLAQEKNISVHLDGARLFHAVVASGTPVRKFADTVDSVQICLSKGLCAPIGSLLVGNKAFIARARKWRKALGGGMRQAGVIAAPGLIALTKMVDRLAEDHVRAAKLATGLAAIPGISVDPAHVETNMVVADIHELPWTAKDFCFHLKKRDVLVNDVSHHAIRFVTHLGISDEDIEQTLRVIEKMVRSRS